MIGITRNVERILPRRVLKFAASLFALAFVVAAPRESTAQQTITLKAVAPYNLNIYLSKPMFIFKEIVEKRTNGRVKVNILGGEEVVPSLQQFDALRNGVVDVIVGVTSYYTGTVPEGMALLYTRQLPSKQRESGLFDLMRKVHLEKGGVIYLANAGGTPDTAFRLYLKKPITKPDLTGFKIRVSPVYTPLVSALNGTPVSTPFADTYAALERGVVDGFGSTYAGITDYGLHEVSKYVIDHGFYSLVECILINKKTWDSLPQNVRGELEALAPEYEKAVEEYMGEFIKQEDKLLKSKSMQFIKFSPEDEKKFLDVAYSAGWKEFLAKTPENGAQIKAVAEK